MARILITEYKGCLIYWEDCRESTASEPYWVIVFGNSVLLIDKTKSLDEIKKMIDELQDGK